MPRRRENNKALIDPFIYKFVEYLPLPNNEITAGSTNNAINKKYFILTESILLKWKLFQVFLRLNSSNCVLMITTGSASYTRRLYSTK